MEGLGKDYDIALNMIPIDASGGAPTSDVINLRNADGVDFILVTGLSAGAGDFPVLTISQHIGIAGGAVPLLVDHYYQKSAVALVAGAPWVRVANGVAGVGITTITGDATSDTEQLIWCVPIEADSLAPGYDCVSVVMAQTGGAGIKLSAAFYLLRNLHVQRTPANLPSPIV
jgi:hypothetical protein